MHTGIHTIIIPPDADNENTDPFEHRCTCMYVRIRMVRYWLYTRPFFHFKQKKKKIVYLIVR